MFLVVPLAKMALQVSNSRRHGMLCVFLRVTVFHYLTRQYIRDAVFPSLHAWSGNAHSYNSICAFCGRGSSTQIPAVERVFPHHFPVGTYTCHGIGFLQQYIIPATAKIHGAAGREYHTDRPSCRITLLIGTDRQSATRIWNKRGHTTGNKYDEQYSAATIYTIGSETHPGMVVCGYSCYRRHITLHSFS